MRQVRQTTAPLRTTVVDAISLAVSAVLIALAFYFGL
jgi:hypothetical protein